MLIIIKVTICVTLTSTRHSSSYFKYVNSFNPHNNRLRWVLYDSHLADEETEIQRDEMIPS